jgi:hypothetical protein
MQYPVPFQTQSLADHTNRRAIGRDSPIIRPPDSEGTCSDAATPASDAKNISSGIADTAIPAGREISIGYYLPDDSSRIWICDTEQNMLLCCDTGAPTTVAGIQMAKAACKKLNVPYKLKESARAFRFEDTRRKSIGTLKLPFPTPAGISDMSLDVVDLDIPVLLGLDTLDSMKAYLNTVENELVGPDWTLPLLLKAGHVYLPVPALQYHFSRSELWQLHRAFYHPSATKLYQLIRKAKPQETDKDTLELLEDISKSCNACQRISRKPVLFAVGGTEDEDIRFNRVILLDLMYLETPEGTKPVLHVMDRDTRFHAARFLLSISAPSVWEALVECWIHMFSGMPNTLLVDQGSQLRSDEFKGITQQAGISLRHTGIEAHSSLGLLERYHDAIRRTYDKVRLEDPHVRPSMALSAAVKAANDCTGPTKLTTLSSL